MKRRVVLYLTLAALYLLHNDFWFWHRSDLVFGLPLGLVYHVSYCLAVSIVMVLVVKSAWPIRGRRGSDPGNNLS